MFTETRGKTSGVYYGEFSRSPQWRTRRVTVTQLAPVREAVYDYLNIMRIRGNLLIGTTATAQYEK